MQSCWNFRLEWKLRCPCTQFMLRQMHWNNLAVSTEVEYWVSRNIWTLNKRQDELWKLPRMRQFVQQPLTRNQGDRTAENAFLRCHAHASSSHRPWGLHTCQWNPSHWKRCHSNGIFSHLQTRQMILQGGGYLSEDKRINLGPGVFSRVPGNEVANALVTKRRGYRRCDKYQAKTRLPSSGVNDTEVFRD